MAIGSIPTGSALTPTVMASAGTRRKIRDAFTRTKIIRKHSAKRSGR